MKHWLYKIKFWFWSILAAFSGGRAAFKEKALACQIQPGWLITLSDKTQEKKEFMNEWIKPENIEARRKKHEEEAPKALERAKKMLEEMDAPILPPLPPREEIPEEWRNQPESTIRALIRQKKENASLSNWGVAKGKGSALLMR